MGNKKSKTMAMDSRCPQIIAYSPNNSRSFKTKTMIINTKMKAWDLMKWMVILKISIAIQWISTSYLSSCNSISKPLTGACKSKIRVASYRVICHLKSSSFSTMLLITCSLLLLLSETMQIILVVSRAILIMYKKLIGNRACLLQ